MTMKQSSDFDAKSSQHEKRETEKVSQRNVVNISNQIARNASNSKSYEKMPDFKPKIKPTTKITDDNVLSRSIDNRPNEGKL